MEYAFCDTGKELPETYEFLDRLEAFLGKKNACRSEFMETAFGFWRILRRCGTGKELPETYQFLAVGSLFEKKLIG